MPEPIRCDTCGRRYILTVPERARDTSIGCDDHDGCERGPCRVPEPFVCSWCRVGEWQAKAVEGAAVKARAKAWLASTAKGEAHAGLKARVTGTGGGA